METELRDDYGLLRWYRDIFFQASKGREDFDWGRLYGLLTVMQRQFNEVNDRECRGLRFMHLKSRSDEYCNHPMCPTCYHIKQRLFLKALQALPPAPYLFLRSTWLVRWDDTLHPKLLQRFKGRGSYYKLVGYSMNYHATSPVITDTIRKHDEYRGELAYQVSGIFTSDRLVKDKGVVSGFGRQAHVYDRRDVVGVVDRICIDTHSDLKIEWIEHLNHPWIYRKHPTFRDYIHRFHRYRPTGKSWVRVQVKEK